jgi:hypothetical protein
MNIGDTQDPGSLSRADAGAEAEVPAVGEDGISRGFDWEVENAPLSPALIEWFHSIEREVFADKIKAAGLAAGRVTRHDAHLGAVED